VGALGIRPPEGATTFSLDQIRFLEAVSDQCAVALERLRLAERTSRDQVEIEAERLRTALLSSLSHDLRTPLAAVEGAATTLRREGSRLAPAATVELLDSIIGETRRMGTLIRNLLEMVRLESGMLQVQREWQSMEEIVGVALLRLDRVLADHHVTTDIPGDLPLLRVDGLLIELVLVNLLENAANHAGPATPIEIAARATGGSVEVTVRDHGPGVPPDQLEAIFEKFRRLGEGSGQGVGLGLAICRGIVQAHGGRIWAESPADGGLRVGFRLPLPAEQPSPIPEAER
jgi:two-component system sensor histidine kinase KdpD